MRKNYNRIIILLFVLAFAGLNACNQSPKATKKQVVNQIQEKESTALNISGKVLDVIQTTNYTYCQMNVSGQVYWIAISKQNVKQGQTLYFKQGVEMRDFHSQELNRNFSVLYLVQHVSTSTTENSHSDYTLNQEAPKPKIVKNKVELTVAKGGISIAELFAHKEKYAGKKVRIKGKVTKYNPEILGKNWVHIQDGTEYNGHFDLTVTTQEQLSQGMVVVFEGKITLNKDLGSGYFYPVIMENASVKR
jgi:starvation-inducible outer membrane lipoprotein